MQSLSVRWSNQWYCKLENILPYSCPIILQWHLKALVFLYGFEESVDCHLLSSFCDDSNLHISLFKYVLSTMGVNNESISKCLIGNWFHEKLRILSPYWNRIWSWKVRILQWIAFGWSSLCTNSKKFWYWSNILSSSIETFLSSRYYSHVSTFSHAAVCKRRHLVKAFKFSK